MEQSFRMMNTVRWALLVSLVLYFYVSEQVIHRTPHAPPASAFIYALAIVAPLMLLVAGFLRQKFVVAAEEMLRTTPEDSKALVRWRTGNLLFLAVCEAVALYGVVLRIMGGERIVTLPFFLVAALGMLLFGPRRP